jgi:hypothetical protein
MKLKKLLSEIKVETGKVYSNPYATAFKPMNEDETQDSAEVKVGNYQTKYFDVCPGATNVYKDVESKGVDMDLAERAVKLQDALFFIEKHVVNNDETGSSEGYITVAQNLSDQIMAMAGMMGLEEEHSYIQGHVDTITKAVSDSESVDEGVDGMSKQELDRAARGMFGKSYSRLTMDQEAKLKFYLRKSKKESVNEADDVYHKSYTHAIEAAEVYAKKKGYEIEDDEMFTKVGMNSKRPSVGKTTRVSLELLKNGKPQRKMLHIQVYGMKNGYELNAYIN